MLVELYNSSRPFRMGKKRKAA